MSFRWISKKAAISIHHEQLTQHGGLPGIRDEGLLESALAKPQNLSSYQDATIARCAASYMYGIVRNHPFLDGNKRTGFVVGITFLILNGFYIKVEETEVVIKITALAEGTLSEKKLDQWLDKIAFSL